MVSISEFSNSSSMFFKLEILLYLLGIFFIEVEPKSEFSLKITKFFTYSYHRLDGKCCGVYSDENHKTCPRPCVQRYKICLEYYQAHVSLTNPKPYSGPCAYGKKDTEIWGNSDMTYILNSIFRQKFTIINSWPGSITLIIEAYDSTEISHYREAVIDRIAYKTFLKSTKPDEWNNVLLSNGRSAYEFSMNLICKVDYYGEFCDRYCKNNAGHYKCDKNGEKICEYGWMGNDCNTTVCLPGCHRIHGYCSSPGECRCREGWEGKFCDECIKYPGCKHGTCVDSPWTCRCENNWGGQFCDQSLNYCAENNPCKNGGICENLPSETQRYQCICSSGFEGQNCEIDLCVPNPCKKGTCFKSKNGFYCQCLADWTGKLCDQDSRICDQNSCQNGGQCTKDSSGTFGCICLPGFTGSECHIAAPCKNSQCKHAKECQIQSTNMGDYKCNCHDGWTGKYCDKEINECESSPCKNGVCKDLINDYSCKCDKGFTGKNCEFNVACQNQQCKNGGVCQETDRGYICKCKTGYTGINCEIYKTGCSPNPCLNGAYCYTIEQDFYCHCNENYWGKRCEFQRPYCGKESCENVYDACSMPQMINSSGIKHNFCGKYGTCVSQGKQDFICRCMPGFEGASCEININNCESDTCSNHGICIDSIDDFECICDNGYFGKKCEQKMNFCSKNPCMNDGECIEQSNGFYSDFSCRCKNDWGGQLCHLPKSNICIMNQCLNNGKCIEYEFTGNGFQCNCEDNWVGTVCQYRSPGSLPCIKNPCKNQGKCLNVGYNDYTCHCSPGYEGRQCEININECHPNPCFNGGECVDKVNSYKCRCAKGFYGSNCQLNIDECAIYPCAYGAICVDRIDGYECRCPEGRDGKLCDHVTNNGSPQPPSCVYINRIFDSGESWSYNCQNCVCDRGKVTCIKIPCGVWTCLQANGTDDPYACKPGEICHPLPFYPNLCFVPPCVPKGKCIKQIDFQRITTQWPGEAPKDCQPNSIQKSNYCAQILLKFNKLNLPIGVTVNDICDSLKTLKSIQSLKDTLQGSSMGITCDVNDRDSSIVNVAIYSPSDEMRRAKPSQTYRPFAHYLSDLIADDLVNIVKSNITLFSGLKDITIETLLLNADLIDRSNLIKYLLVPIFVCGFFVLAVAYWYHRKKNKEIREKYTNPIKINNNNIQNQPINPVRTQYPILRPSVQNKHLTDTQNFYDRNSGNFTSRFAWSKLQHPFQN